MRRRSIAKVGRIEVGDADVQSLSHRLVFKVMIGNADMHHENGSVIYRHARLLRSIYTVTENHGPFVNDVLECADA